LQETIHTRLQQQPSGALQNFKEKAGMVHSNGKGRGISAEKRRDAHVEMTGISF
jgi:hypothetical protein